MIDLNNKFVVPGFMDNHTHFMSGGSMLMSIDLHSAKTPDVFKRRFQSYIKNYMWIRMELLILIIK